MLKLVFYVEDENKNIIGEKKQMMLDITEEKLVEADTKDAEKLKKTNDLIGEQFANYSAYGRGRYLREMFDATGTLISRYLQRELAKKFGDKRFDLMDAIEG